MLLLQPDEAVTHLLWWDCETDRTDCRLCAKPIAQQTQDFRSAPKDKNKMGNKEKKKTGNRNRNKQNHNSNDNINQTETSIQDWMKKDATQSKQTGHAGWNAFGGAVQHVATPWC